jgi:Cep192 domain 4
MDISRSNGFNDGRHADPVQPQKNPDQISRKHRASRTPVNGYLTASFLVLALVVVGAQQAHAQLSSNTTSVKFGSVAVGNHGVKTITLKNTGTSNLTVEQASVTGAAFTVSSLNLPLTLKPGAKSTFDALFAPTAVGKVLGSISLTNSGSTSPLVVSLAGTGKTLSLSVSPASTNFGDVTVGNNGTLPILISNTGSTSITVTQAVLTGNGFSISGLSLPLTLRSGKNSSFDVTFSPASAGAFTGNIAVVSNATNSPGNASLSGIGVNQHVVTLSWSASNSQNVAGYDVFRSMIPGGPYSQVNASLVASTNYTDNTVLAGTVYYYVTTAVNSGGVQSAYSDQAEAQVPLP